ncbi:hypothetical protein ATG98_3549 [Marinobacter sp. LV10R520-4]|uniref:hypothetical protein n=1 Tax=Marinobacter sp. LV10R520-4 TaxID=1761796 RepID=UPI000BF6C5DC|nr:hypothetical protein [Marinobacter sp. LV10R520-4]PFG54328.1 hypothetical protein ATG98_3549 [Marinobacter sp. LV10R520-4]
MVGSNLTELRSEVAKERKRAAVQGLPWFFLAFILSYLAWADELVPFELSVGSLAKGQILFCLSLLPWFAFAVYAGKYNSQQWLLSEAKTADQELQRILNSSSIGSIKDVVTAHRQKGGKNPLVQELLDANLPRLAERIRILRTDEAYATLSASVQKATSRIDPFLRAEKNNLPIFKARSEIKASAEFLGKRREELQQQWDQAYEQFSWWNKLKYGGGPDFSKIDKLLTDLRVISRKLERKHGQDFVAIEKHFETLREQAIDRVHEAQRTGAEFIRQIDGDAAVGSEVLRKSMWLSMLSIPVSVWFDADQATNVFDAVRGINGEFAGMSDSEIWWETLFLPTESLAGLAALTKGAYFERLVAADTGGQLHEHFNHPGTDVVIDGTAFQLKATDSEAYVNSVSDGIPVIATSEVAWATGSIDSGFTNEELNSAVGLALGGTIVDIGDTTVDAVLAGVGGLGFFATLEGLNHAVKKHENGGDAVEAMFEGAGVAIEGTARALVGAVEMGYNVLASRPSRFVGRVLLKGAKKLDDKMMAAGEQK